MKALALRGVTATAVAILAACSAPSYHKEPGVLISRLGGDACALVIDRADGTTPQRLERAKCVSMPDRALQVTVAGCAPLVLQSVTASGPIDGYVCISCGKPRTETAQCPLGVRSLPESWAFQ